MGKLSSKWQLSWGDEDPGAFIFIAIVLSLLFMAPWDACDPLSELKYGPAPEAPEKADKGH